MGHVEDPGKLRHRSDSGAHINSWNFLREAAAAGISSNALAWSLPEHAIHLPSYHDISDEGIERLVQVVKSLVV